jgi:predicted lipid-binding transport protein (Tim44 family)
MLLNRSKAAWLRIALFGPALITLAYLAATEFPQRLDGPALPLRACGTPETDLVAALIAIVVGLFGLGVVTQARSILLFVPLAFFYFLAQLFLIAGLTMGWAWLFGSSRHQRLFDPQAQCQGSVLASDLARGRTERA